MVFYKNNKNYKNGNKMNILALIPARMGSSRFPGKPMAKILGRPMIGHVYKNVAKCDLLTKTVVATCDDEIKDYIESIGGEAVMTGSHHERASDRCAEALGCIEKKDGVRYDIIVMVQGDEPMTHPDMITEAVTPMLNDSKILVTNLLGDIDSIEEFKSKNCIKVVCDQQSHAIYFSREPIPSSNKSTHEFMKKQVCIIPFTRKFLLKYTKLSPTPLEISESIDMLRVLEYGLKVKMIPTKYKTHAVDTVDDLIYVEKALKK
jgi:3-deoxy-manno-octulosonate cytidylyltransferase (CMP-KDO synthetase)